MPELPEPIPHLVDAIYAAIVARTKSSDSLGVPISQAAAECDRQTWYAFRWSHPLEEITGQKERRFETGQCEEKRLLDDLEAIGVIIERLDPATGKQFRAELADGWLRGKIDARATGIPEAPKALHIVECKTHNDRSFKELLKHAQPKGEGLKSAKPEHYAQVQLYMHALGIQRALYLAVNKNDDALYSERIKYDFAFALAIEAKVRRIVSSDRAPPRLHDDVKSKAAFACQWCPALALCHEGKWARRNCRTCLSASFEDGAIVRCTLYDKTLSYDEQQTGCDKHLYLPTLVLGEQIDAGERWVKYLLTNGEEWIDGDY